MSGANDLAYLRAQPHVSFSAISSYLRCPRSYEARYVRRVPPARRARPLPTGSIGISSGAATSRRIRRPSCAGAGTSGRRKGMVGTENQRAKMAP